jgi:hypothetical protein
MNKERYAQLKHFRLNGVNFKKVPDYGCYRFSGELTTPEAQALSDNDILIIIDEGSYNFGSEFNREGNKFWGKIYTD